MKRRGRDEIMADILKAVMEEGRSSATAYRIINKVHVSFSQGEKYLDTLVRGKLLDYDKTTHFYSVTERAIRFRQLHENLYGMMDVSKLRDTLAE